MRPTSNRLLIQIPEAPKDLKVDGIFIPENAEKAQYPEAKVMAAGPKCLDVKEGDTVIIDRYAMASVRLIVKGQLYFVIAEPDVLAIINK